MTPLLNHKFHIGGAQNRIKTKKCTVERFSRESICYFHDNCLRKYTKNDKKFREHLGEHFCKNKQMSSFSVFYYKKAQKRVSNVWKRDNSCKGILTTWEFCRLGQKFCFPEFTCFCANFRENLVSRKYLFPTFYYRYIFMDCFLHPPWDDHR